MRVLTAAAVGMVLFGAGCAQPGLRPASMLDTSRMNPGVSHEVAASLSGLSSSRTSPHVAADVQPLDGASYVGWDESLAMDRAEAFLAGTESLWPEASDPKVVSRAETMLEREPEKLRRGLGSAARYMGIIRREFRAVGVPLALGFLPIIESNFSLSAVSPARAVGIWQFTAPTAQRYGLVVNREIDERRDPEKATRAAAHLLRDLYDRFARWDLAIAAYNAGPGTVDRALSARPGATDFWGLADRLPGETRAYVPKVLATALIASRPGDFGLADVDHETPLRYDTALVLQRLDIGTIATLCGSTREAVAELNPSLRRGVVPAVDEGYPVRLPHGTGKRFELGYAAWRNGQVQGPGTPGYRSEI